MIRVAVVILAALLITSCVDSARVPGLSFHAAPVTQPVPPNPVP